MLAAALIGGCATAAAVRDDTRAREAAVHVAIRSASPEEIEAGMSRRFFEMMLLDDELAAAAPERAAEQRATEEPAAAHGERIAALERSFEHRVGMTPVEVVREAQRRAVSEPDETHLLEVLGALVVGGAPEPDDGDPFGDLAGRTIDLLQRRVDAVAAPLLATAGRDEAVVLVDPAQGASASAVLAVPGKRITEGGVAATPVIGRMLRDLERAPDAPRAALGLGVAPVVAIGPEMVLVTRDDDQLACLIGHELAHVELGHAQTAVWTTAGERLVGMTGGAIVRATLSNGIPVVGPLLLELTSAEELMGKALVGAPLRVTGYERAQEFAADRWGQELAARAGYDPGACAALVLESARHAAAFGDGNVAAVSYFAAHPPATERILALREGAENVRASAGLVSRCAWGDGGACAPRTDASATPSACRAEPVAPSPRCAARWSRARAPSEGRSRRGGPRSCSTTSCS